MRGMVRKMQLAKVMKVFIRKETFHQKAQRLYKNVGKISLATLLTLVVGLAAERVLNSAIDNVMDINLDCLTYNLKLKDDCKNKYKYQINFNALHQKIAAGLARDKTLETPLESLIVDRIILKDQSLYAKTRDQRDQAFNTIIGLEQEINKITGNKAVFIGGKKVWNIWDYYAHEINYSEAITAQLVKRLAATTSPEQQTALQSELNTQRAVKIELTAKVLYLQSYDSLVNKFSGAARPEYQSERQARTQGR